jgi:DNA-directed RNA polymerase specialized sigma24 family protein
VSGPKNYVAKATRGDGWWALIVEDAGGHPAATQCRRLDQAEAVVADLLATLLGGNPDEFAVEVVPVLDNELRTEVAEARAKRTRAEDASTSAVEASRKAARDLALRGLSQRDIAVLLGLTHQRVSQLLAS